MDLAVDEPVHDIGPPFVHLEDGLDRQPCRSQRLGRPLRGHQAETEAGEASGDGNEVPLVEIVHGEEYRPRQRQGAACRDLCLGEGVAEGVGDPHDLSGGFHLRAENRILSRELDEREDRFLHEHALDFGLLREAQLPQTPPHHHAGRDLRQRHSGGLADEGDRP